MVHYGEANETKAALASLYAGTRQPDHIVIVDHGPSQLTLPDSPNLTVVRPQHNGGYGAGINIGLGALVSQRAKHTDIVVAMNNDIIVQSDSLEELALFWEQNPDPALVGVTIKEGSRVVAGLSSVNLFTGRAHLYKKPYKFTPWWRSYSTGLQPKVRSRCFFECPLPRFFTCARCA